MKNDDNKFNFQDRPKINVDGEKQRMRVDYPRKAHREEYGAEVAPPTVVRTGGTERAEPVPEKHEADRVMESTRQGRGLHGTCLRDCVLVHVVNRTWTGSSGTGLLCLCEWS